MLTDSDGKGKPTDGWSLEDGSWGLKLSKIEKT